MVTQELNVPHWTKENIPSQEGRLAIITGANSGIGFESARLLAEAGARVILACRSSKRGLDAVSRIKQTVDGADVVFEALDLADLHSVRQFANLILNSETKLDILINNAGVMYPDPSSKTKQGFELQLGVNHLGHFALTSHLTPLLLKTESSRVVTVASLMHKAGSINFDDLQWKTRRYNKWSSYGQSKLANLLFTKELDRRFRDHGSSARALSCHPGWTRTELQRNASFVNALGFLAMDAEAGALTTLRAAVDSSLEGNSYIGPKGFMEAWGPPDHVSRTAEAEDDAVARRLWDESAKLTGVQPVI